MEEKKEFLKAIKTILLERREDFLKRLTEGEVDDVALTEAYNS